ncbi:DEAD/DEAH box helicase [Fictibacillus barbaricus]|uniref:DEAD/DEAH box helicase n=1 Tax=Fictibacillus barbaricus TaxID=182136 RepID=A0ABS2ZIY3_9BACL|nr:DEAD/DEAH box helicase [Fictibacillus barbaricus]MBN3547890.1 DEAD/DEAH box helicase [Fictibacillus barbaricus]GGB52369.1 DEAD-box ATP-dependent RNA helicase CshC [Fictibacillus barbaricus]
MTKSLHNFPDFIQTAWNKSGFTSLTDIQERALPDQVDNKDMIIESPTGTGKTLAYALPALSKLNPGIKNAQVLFLAPTRELAMQIYEVCQKFTENSGLSGASLIGGANMQRQLDKLKKKPQYIVGTPGRVKELIQNKKLKVHDVKTIVIDEADHIIEAGFNGDVEQVIGATLKDRQLVFVSATINKKTEDWSRKLAVDPVVVKVQKEAVESQVTHTFMVSDYRDKVDNLRKLIRHTPDIKAMVFINSSMKMDEFASKLEYKKIKLGVLAGNSTKQERQKVLNDFKNGKIPVLLTTDVATRGLDIPDITHVVHFELPEDVKQYVHRSGRTGRMGKEGTVVSLVTKAELSSVKKWTAKMNVTLQKQNLEKGQVVIEEINKTSYNERGFKQDTKVSQQKTSVSKKNRESDNKRS